MIFSEVTQTQLKKWRDLYQKQGALLNPNRISGIQLNDYFQNKYFPQAYHNDEFKEIVKQNVNNYYLGKKSTTTSIAAYTIDGDVLVGIDLNSGYFHIESLDIYKCIPIYDDLFVKRGLDQDDLKNFVLVGQYLELIG